MYAIRSYYVQPRLHGTLFGQYQNSEYNGGLYDREAAALRWSGPLGAGHDALAISGDGRDLAWGWT